ncbi:hypothetical protein [Umboniibacter marinipuniceus]|uniref:Alginate export domain-containing protein n=1 Tax=Umboniibacter marinipuniceus TaxID=569599 RepID=A0A3M0A2S1_9GAMM|nr:hypothetical protein [Umboniibacter marinipuniceus]RMA78744.1 hypothetical protein DFR27_2082 [Umboniibacter marinipuniceus]
MKPLSLIPVVLLGGALLSANVCEANVNGHIKGQYQNSHIPSNSALQPWVGSTWEDGSGELRLNWSDSWSGWKLETAYQLVVTHGDSLSLPPTPGLPNVGGNELDASNWWQLSWEISSSDNQQSYHRFDRINIGYQWDKLSLNFGRQAVTWGNGTFFNPMDVLNPFDPLAIDSEYKSGADMLYGQYLFESGSDLQGLMVVRRNKAGEVASDQFSQALHYHQFVENAELSILIAHHYDDRILGLGWSSSLGDAVWQSDVTFTQTTNDDFWNLVSGLSYSWYAFNSNFSGAIEYFFSGVGLPGDRYQVDDIASNEALAKRLDRGELFTLGRNYLGANVTMEVHPLLNVSTNAVTNLRDHSMMLQLMGLYDAAESMRITGVVGLPIGAEGTEYGGLEAPIHEQFFSSGVSAYLQVAWYF